MMNLSKWGFTIDDIEAGQVKRIKKGMNFDLKYP